MADICHRTGPKVGPDSFVSSSVVYYSKPETAKYDPEAAKALLAEAGYADGLKIKLTTVAGNSNYETMATMVKEMLSQVGIDRYNGGKKRDGCTTNAHV